MLLLTSLTETIQKKCFFILWLRLTKVIEVTVTRFIYEDLKGYVKLDVIFSKMTELFLKISRMQFYDIKRGKNLILVKSTKVEYDSKKCQDVMTFHPLLTDMIVTCCQWFPLLNN